MHSFFPKGFGTAVAGLVFVAVFSGQNAGAQVITSNPQLPPDVGGYLSQFHATFADGSDIYNLNNIIHTGFTNVVRQLVGPDEHETFDSTLFADLTINSVFMGPIVLTGPVETIVYSKAGNTTGTFETEILSMDLSGNVGGNTILIRENPGESSKGSTTIIDIGGGLFEIDSFFDVFTELSLDGGINWIPAQTQPPVGGGPQGSTRVELHNIPEPTTLAILALGLAGIGFTRRKRRS